MRVFLVVMDDTEEAGAALRFAARRAAAVGGTVHILAVVPPQSFNAFGAIQDTIEREARDRAEMLAHGAAGALLSESGIMPAITVGVGEPRKVVRDYLDTHPEVAALVLGASKGKNPGPLVTHFSATAATLPCPLYIVPPDYEEREDKF